MNDSFNMFIVDVIIFFKRKNFTITREFEFCGKKIKEYVYNMKRYFTDVWPPILGTGPPIKKVVRDSDGVDVTKNVIKFSGPMKNHLNPLGVYTKKRKMTLKYTEIGGIRISYEHVWEPYYGTVTVTDTLGFKKIVHVNDK